MFDTLKSFSLKLGVVALRGVYAPMKFFLKPRKKYVFATKAANMPSLDFLLLEKELKKRHPNHEVVMLCKTMDRKVAYIPHLFVQMYHFATCEVVFLDRSCLVAHVLNHRSELQIVQLWHALGCMKKFGYAILDTPEGQKTEIARTLRMHHGYTAITISSFSFLKDFKEGFHTDGSNVYQIPLPRVDFFLNEEVKKEARRRIYQEHPELAAKKIIVYCPTWRKGSSSLEIASANLFDALVKRGLSLICSPHPVYGASGIDSRVAVYPDLTTQQLLLIASAVVTDYSSVIYEAGLLKVPVFLYSYDWSCYRSERSHNLDLSKDVPAVFSASAEVIAESICCGDFDQGRFAEFVSRNVTLPDSGTCCSAIVDLIDGVVQESMKCPDYLVG